MKKSDVVKQILAERFLHPPLQGTVSAFAPTNIALIKYWGKRNAELNLPMTSSLSISLDKGAATLLTFNQQTEDIIFLNGQRVNNTSSFAIRLINYLDLFRQTYPWYFTIEITSTVPIAAGLASSACGFASIASALNKIFNWNLSLSELSILARLGSGSASRSLWRGFVKWEEGEREDGIDSHGILLEDEWTELCIGLLIMQSKEKSISSREAMQTTIETNLLYEKWPQKVKEDLIIITESIKERNFEVLGKTAEWNALSMHALMLSAWPPIQYALPETITAMQKIWNLRASGLPLYFTQDAGPNLKLLFLEKDKDKVKHYFPELDVMQPFKL